MENTAMIPVGDLFAIVDAQDFPLVSGYEWDHEKGKRYARSGRHWLHRLVMGAPKGVEVDHIDGDELNNRRSNLRIATHAQNQRNKRKTRGKSRFKGVYAKAGRWQASLTCDGKTVYIGLFATQEEAARAYDRAALEHFGEFARLNFPQEVA